MNALCGLDVGEVRGVELDQPGPGHALGDQAAPGPAASRDRGGRRSPAWARGWRRSPRAGPCRGRQRSRRRSPRDRSRSSMRGDPRDRVRCLLLERLGEPAVDHARHDRRHALRPDRVDALVPDLGRRRCRPRCWRGPAAPDAVAGVQRPATARPCRPWTGRRTAPARGRARRGAPARRGRAARSCRGRAAPRTGRGRGCRSAARGSGRRTPAAAASHMREVGAERVRQHQHRRRPRARRSGSGARSWRFGERHPSSLPQASDRGGERPVDELGRNADVVERVEQAVEVGRRQMRRHLGLRGERLAQVPAFGQRALGRRARPADAPPAARSSRPAPSAPPRP